jgi:hypothetical protein
MARQGSGGGRSRRGKAPEERAAGQGSEVPDPAAGHARPARGAKAAAAGDRRRGPRASQPPDAPPVTSEEEARRRLIAEAAYYRAQQRGFVGGDPVQDWLEAEAEVTRRLQGRPDPRAWGPAAGA